MYDCIIIGLGPAGLMAGINISDDKKVLILERNKKPGRKLIITGNGRCNVTNLKDNNLFLEEINYNKKYLYSTINNFGPRDIYNYFIENNVLLKEESDNRIFPVSDKATDILDALINNLNKKKFEIKYDEEVLKITNGDIKKVMTSKNCYETKNIIIAVGGASFKHTGSKGDHMNFAKMINQPVISLFPCEVGIILKEKNTLAGTSFSNVTIKYNKYKSSGSLIFTHKGLSGEAIMRLSEHIYKNDEKDIYIDLLPEKTIEELKIELENFDKNKNITTFLNNYFSKKFSNYLLENLKIDLSLKIKNLNNKEKDMLINLIKNNHYEILKVDDINNAYVTGGGIDLNYIDTKTMESKINKGIYFIGESLDIHGPIGGYNITLAMSTGVLAGQNIK